MVTPRGTFTPGVAQVTSQAPGAASIISQTPSLGGVGGRLGESLSDFVAPLLPPGGQNIGSAYAWGQQVEAQRILAARYGAAPPAQEERRRSSRGITENTQRQRIREEERIASLRAWAWGSAVGVVGTQAYQERQRILAARSSAQAPAVATMGGQAKTKLRPTIDTGGYGGGGGGYGGGSDLINWRIGY